MKETPELRRARRDYSRIARLCANGARLVPAMLKGSDAANNCILRAMKAHNPPADRPDAEKDQP